jgi:hypothetical protein
VAPRRWSGRTTGSRRSRGVEAGQLEVDVDIDGDEVLELDLEQIRIPGRVLRQPVVRQPVGAELGLREVLDADDGDAGELEASRGEVAQLARNNPAVRTDDDRVDEAEPADGLRQLLELARRVPAGIARVEVERV